MPNHSRSTIPTYRLHRPSGQAVVTLSDRDFYLGVWNTDVSRAEYDRLVAEWIANGRRIATKNGITINDVMLQYWQFVEQHYVKEGRATDEQDCIRAALRPLRRMYGRYPAREFGPLALKGMRQSFLDAKLCRSTINAYVNRIRRMFRWAVSEQLIPVEVYQALTTVNGLVKGRTTAREPDLVRPVPESDMRATLPHLPPPVRAMVEVQFLTGCRPGEICILRPCDIDRSGDVWCFVPHSHKTEHHDRQRRIFIGPQAQEILKPWLNRTDDSFAFCPRESVIAKPASRRKPLSQRERARRPRLRRRGLRYTNDSYRRAVTRGCETAKVPAWTPNQLRHSRATVLRAQFGLEAAQTVLGHSQVNVTQIYAERDFASARRIIGLVG